MSKGYSVSFAFKDYDAVIEGCIHLGYHPDIFVMEDREMIVVHFDEPIDEWELQDLIETIKNED